MIRQVIQEPMFPHAPVGTLNPSSAPYVYIFFVFVFLMAYRFECCVYGQCFQFLRS